MRVTVDPFIRRTVIQLRWLLPTVYGAIYALLWASGDGALRTVLLPVVLVSACLCYLLLLGTFFLMTRSGR